MPWSIIREILASPAGSFAFVFGLLCFSGWLIHYVTKKTTSINTEHSTLKESTKKIESFIDELRKDMAYIKGTIELKNDLAQSHSPVSLTQKGKEVCDEIGAEEIVANNWSKIKNTLNNEVHNKNAYDIQQYCIETAAVEPEKFFNNTDLEKIKLFAFKKGKSFQYFSMVFAIIIRDKFFAEKGIDTNDVDKHDPRKS